VLVCSKYAFNDFIYDASAGYFNTELHEKIFEIMEDMALLTFHATEKVFSSERGECFQLTLTSKNKALRFTHADPNHRLVLSIFKLSRVGRQLFDLCDVKADLAYMFQLASHAKAKGFKVILGEWTDGNFIEKMLL
jgi:hypothetical protein